MTRTFEQMCAERDPVYAGTRPAGMMEIATELDAKVVYHRSIGEEHYAIINEWAIPKALLALTIRAMRNQGQPYYDARQP